MDKEKFGDKEKLGDNEKFLHIENLRVEYKTDGKTAYAVNGIDFELNKGEVIGFVGETGAGKTSMALAIMKLIPSPPGRIAGGEVWFENKDIMTMSEKEMRAIRGNKITMIFQDPMTSLNPVLTVGEQIGEVIRLHNKLSAEEVRKKAAEMLEMVGIDGKRADEYPHQFSGGMKQRVVIAIALACNPSLLIADEPTTALDVTIQAQVLELMVSLKERLGTSMIMITHDLGVVAEICDKVAIMYAGEIVEAGRIEEIFENRKHPYTEGLFDSIPDLEVEMPRLKSIKGMMPSPCDLPSGCVFAPRCPYAMDICDKKKPEKFYFSDDHYARCHRYDVRDTEEKL